MRREKRTPSDRAKRGKLVPGPRATGCPNSQPGEGRERQGEGPLTPQLTNLELTIEAADRMVTEALDCEPDEPEPLVKLLLFLHDLHELGKAPELSDSFHRLMTAAYNNSIVHSGNFYEYLDSIRQSRSLIKRARARIARG